MIRGGMRWRKIENTLSLVITMQLLDNIENKMKDTVVEVSWMHVHSHRPPSVGPVNTYCTVCHRAPFLGCLKARWR